VQAFYFVADDLVLATEFKDKDVIFNAYDPGRAAALWRQQFRVRTATRVRQRDSHRAVAGRIYLGNGPLTVIDPATGQHTLVARLQDDRLVQFCRRAFFRRQLLSYRRDEGCGDMEKVQLLSVTVSPARCAGGRRRARIRTRPEHRALGLRSVRVYAGAAPDVNDSSLAPPPDRFVVEGERLFRSITRRAGRRGGSATSRT